MFLDSLRGVGDDGGCGFDWSMYKLSFLSSESS